MSTYKNDNPEHFSTAIQSIIEQTLRPQEIVMVGDGALPDGLMKAVGEAEKRCQDANIGFVFLPLEKNGGLGNALRIATERCSNPYIARMDTDDIALPDRFEKQMKCFAADPSLSITGGMITEFVDTPDNIVSQRNLPLEDGDIKEFMKSRCGVNHMTIIFRKTELMRAGGYNSELRQEDYYLWARMVKAGCKFRNIPDVLVNVRSGRDQFARRSGWQYYLDHMAIFRYMRREGLISWSQLFKNGMVRLFVQVLFPNWLRTKTYQHLLRRRKNETSEGSNLQPKQALNQ